MHARSRARWDPNWWMICCAKKLRLVCGRAHVPTSLCYGQLASGRAHCCRSARTALLT